MANGYDLILSDSCTCTSDQIGYKQFWKDYNGHEFRSELETHDDLTISGSNF